MTDYSKEIKKSHDCFECKKLKFGKRYFNKSTPKLIHDISDAVSFSCTTAMGYSILGEHKTLGIFIVMILTVSIAIKRFFNDD